MNDINIYYPQPTAGLAPLSDTQGLLPQTVTTATTNALGMQGYEVIGRTARQRPSSIDLPSSEIIDRIRQHTRKAATPQMRTGAPDFRIENAATETADVYIYDVIGYDPWTDSGTSAVQFGQELRAITAPHITVHINSPGGEIFTGIAIYNAIRDHPSHVTVRIEGLAASAASFIAMAGDEVLMAPHSMMMIHDPWGIVIGAAADMRAEAGVLDTLANTIASIYAEHASGGKRDDTAQWREYMLAETWYTDEEAVSAGLADGIDREAAEARNTFDLSHFRNAPEHLLTAEAVAETDSQQAFTKRDAERALREADCPVTLAKIIVARGFPLDEEREALPEMEINLDVTKAEEDPELLAATQEALAEADRLVRRAARARELELFQLAL